MPAPQNYKNHTRLDPLFHFILTPILLANIGVTIVWYRHHAYQHAHSGPWAVLMSVVLLLMLGMIRTYSLKVQDRVIRLEERHRLATLVSGSEWIEVESLSIKQYVALRFASNAELPDLARRAVREKLAPKQIKEAIVSWRPDNDRV
jgi:hypothetical protein